MIAVLLWGLAHAVTADHVGTPRDDRVLWTSTLHLDPGQRCTELVVDTVHGAEVCATRPGGTVTLKTEQPFPADRVVVPLAAEGLQRIRLKGAILQPDDLTKSMTGYSTAGVTSGDRRRLDRSLDGAFRPPPGGALYLDPAAVPSTGLPARVAAKAVRSNTAPLAAAGSLFGLGLMGFGYRRLERGARRERLDQWLTDNEIHEP